MKKRILSILLCCVMLAGLLPTVVFAEGGHTHCICGGNFEDGDHTGHSEMTYSAWDGTSSLSFFSDNSARIYLTDMVTRSITIESGQTLYLCLNGWYLNANIVMKENSHLILCDCKDRGYITHSGDDAYGGAVYLNGSTMDMYGGRIIRSSAKRGGAIAAIGGSTLNLYGGEIMGNSASVSGGGIYVDNSTVNVSGAPMVIENTVSGSRNNLVLFDSTVSVKDMTGGEVGITLQNVTYPAAFSGACDKDYKKYFFADDAEAHVEYRGDKKLYLVSNRDPGGIHNWASAWTRNDTHHWHECLDEDCFLFGSNQYELMGSYGVHVYDQEIALDAFMVKGGDATGKERYYKSCVCGAMGTETFEVSEQFSLTPGGTYYFDLSGANIPNAAGNQHYVPFTYAGTVSSYVLNDLAWDYGDAALAASTTADRTARYGYTYAHSLFIADQVVTKVVINGEPKGVSWYALNDNGLIYGKSYASGGIDYTLRAPSGGSAYADHARRIGTPENNEWDTILRKDTRLIKSIEEWAWAQDLKFDSEYAVYNTVRRAAAEEYQWTAVGRDLEWKYYFRPVLEILNADTLGADGLKAVTLSLNRGTLEGSDKSNLQIIVKNGEAFTAPSADGLTRPGTGDYFMWLGNDGKLYAPGESVSASVTMLTAQWTGEAHQHSGGTATCTAQAVCEVCGAPYGEKNPDHHTGSENWTTTDLVHEKAWSCCGKITVAEAAHTWGDDNCCTLCGHARPHRFTAEKAEEQYLKSAATCTERAVYYKSCVDCGLSSQGTEEEATFASGDILGHAFGAWSANGDGTHTRVCSRDAQHTETKDCHGGTATCTAQAVCDDCGGSYGQKKPHRFTAEKAEEQYLKSAATCTEQAVYYKSCVDCGLSSQGTEEEATFTSGDILGHAFGAWSSNGDGTHTRVCSRDAQHTETKDCHGGTATCTAQAICDDCGGSYGQKNPDNHADGEQWIQTATTHMRKCRNCNAVTVAEEKHEWDNGVCAECGYTCTHRYEWQTGNGQYWQKCSDCGLETEPKAIPQIVITGAERVCKTQDYSFRFTLPEGVTGPTFGYAFEMMGDGPLMPTEENGIWTGVLPASLYAPGDTGFRITVYAQTKDGFEITASKEVRLLADHTGGTATCTAPAVCEVCGESYGEPDAANHSDLKHFDAKAATTAAEGNIEYWYCSGCGKYYADAAATREVSQADTITAKLPADKSPKTGDDGNPALWLTLFALSACAGIAAALCSRKKKRSTR